MAGTINPQSTTALSQYYQSLLIIQYLGLPKASGTVGALASMGLLSQTTTQSVTFSSSPTSGSFVLNYGSLATAAIAYNDSASTIQTKLQALSGLGSVTVSGSISSLTLSMTFTGVVPPASTLTVSGNNLSGDSGSVSISVNVTDQTLPFAVLNAYNMIGSTPAVGVQLDVLGKYAGVTRSGFGFNGRPITLSDSDFLLLIKMAIGRNNLGSTLSVIKEFLFTYFPGVVLVFDLANMQMNYLISASLSSDLVELFVQEGLLPKPMGVQLASIIYFPNINSLFGFRTYEAPGSNISPFNTYSDYVETWPWLSYDMTI